MRYQKNIQITQKKAYRKGELEAQKKEETSRKQIIKW